MSEANNTTILDIDALMESTLDSIPDLPDYLNPPTGNYILSVTEAEIKPGKPADPAKKQAAKAARIVITYRVDSTTETSGIPVPDNTLFTEGFQGTEEGIGYFKKQAKKILNVDDLAGVTIRDILDAIKGVQNFAAVVKTATTTGDNGKEYENVNVRPVWPQ